ncbi:spore germination protein (amino acid permease) [Paenibacillus cellulosilyticus]|uniref:Spore germination protein (Amino acid permease) n=1 Tax=Paenibacillus cellulosilyticus TaxID=375489 RepID=A0A2V2YMA0_9BACL|nr:endospore germination permease [Paenibacillus cellulosilyticus]PWV95544.1 spore germination protein (amino acid permease) [Paenibacillus cellulosilyticus]QKS47375.1 endospore germination permease [Paenibacillus cellulosilyticus]
MMATKRFGVWPMIMMMMLSVGIVNHVIIVPLVLDEAGRDAWLCPIISTPFIMLWAIFPIRRIVWSLHGQSFQDWLRARGSGALYWLIVAPILLLLVFTSFHTTVDAVEFANSTYAPLTPSAVVMFFFMALCAYAALAGLRTIAFVSCILLPIVVVLGEFVMTANLPHKDYKFLLPIAENGIQPIISGSFYSLSTLAEVFMIILIQPHLRGQIGRWGLVLLVAVLAILMLGPTSAAIAEFGPSEASKMRYPAFSQWRLVTVGRYIEHLDFFAIFQWLSGAFIRVSMTMYLITSLVCRTRKAQVIVILVLGSVLGVVAGYVEHRQVMYQELIKMYFHTSGIAIILLSLVLWVIAVSGNRQHRQDHTNPSQAEEGGGAHGTVNHEG